MLSKDYAIHQKVGKDDREATFLYCATESLDCSIACMYHSRTKGAHSVNHGVSLKSESET